MKQHLGVVWAWLGILLISGCRTVAPQADGAPRPWLSAPEMLEKALPAVVTVATYATTEAKAIYGFAAKPTDIAYRTKPNLQGAHGAGSGFIIERSGKKYVVTNAHVIDPLGDEREAVAGFSINGTKYPLRVVGADTFYDIAVLEFVGAQPGAETAVIDFRKSEPRIGESVYALGNPMAEFPYSVTSGIVSGKNRKPQGIEGMAGRIGYLQSSATVTWGNSGGPLVDQGGQVLGINSQCYFAFMPFGTFLQQQLNFVLESKVAERAVTDILKFGRVQRAYLGIVFCQAWTRQPLTRQDHTVKVYGKIRIVKALPEGPAGEALKGMEHAVVNSVNGVSVGDVEELLGELESIKPGQEVLLGLTQGDKSATARLVAGELTMAGHAELGRAFAKLFFNKDVGESAGSVILAGRKEPLKEYYWSYAFEHDKKGNVLLDDDGSAKLIDEWESDKDMPFVVRAAGSVQIPADEDPLWWSIRNPVQMGMVSRLAGPAGHLSIAGTIGGKETVRSYYFFCGSDFNGKGDNAFVKVVIY